MPDFLTKVVAGGTSASTLEVGLRLLLALALGRLVAFVYYWTRSASERTPSFPPTLVLLSVLIAMVTQVIGDNVARAFSLVGALSIVRFRTVVRDTEDTAFVIFAVVVGMAIGANDLSVALIGIAVVGIGALWMRPARSQKGSDGEAYVLHVRLALGSDLNALVRPVLAEKLSEYRLLSVGTAKQGMQLDASYEIRLKKQVTADDVVKALNRVDGVYDVELTAPPETTENI